MFNNANLTSYNYIIGGYSILPESTSIVVGETSERFVTATGDSKLNSTGPDVIVAYGTGYKNTPEGLVLTGEKTIAKTFKTMASYTTLRNKYWNYTTNLSYILGSGWNALFKAGASMTMKYSYATSTTGNGIFYLDGTYLDKVSLNTTDGYPFTPFGLTSSTSSTAYDMQRGSIKNNPQNVLFASFVGTTVGEKGYIPITFPFAPLLVLKVGDRSTVKSRFQNTLGNSLTASNTIIFPPILLAGTTLTTNGPYRSTDGKTIYYYASAAGDIQFMAIG